MGYTHSWSHDEIPKSTWNRKVMPVTNALIAMAEHEGIHLVFEFDEPDRRPEVTDSSIYFNGGNGEHGETFVLQRHNKSKFRFCKTARRPYDQVVVAILRFIELITSKFEFGSDGDDNEMRDGEDMLLKCLNEYFPLQYPATVRRLLDLRAREITS